MSNGGNIVTNKKLTISLSLAIIYICWSSGVVCDDIYHEIHRVWPSLRMPNVIISKVAPEEHEILNGNRTMLPAFPAQKSSSAATRKTVVFPSPICISLPMAPCIILQIFWRNSSSSVLGVRVPTNRIPSWPRPRERQLSNSQFYKMYLG